MVKSNVDAFIKEKVLPEYRPIVSAFRTLVKERFPELTEEMRGGTEKYYGVPVYRLNRIVITVSPTKKGVTFAFTDGGSFEDKHKLLEGVGAKTQNIRLSSEKDFKKTQMTYYIKQAIAADKRK